MASEKVKEFLEAARTDAKAAELINSYAAPADQKEEVRIYAEIAAKLGFDVTEADLSAYQEEQIEAIKQKTENTSSKIESLPDDAISEVAGGRRKPNGCYDTYTNKENCWFNDGCDSIINKYANYICHYLAQCTYDYYPIR
ncbi:MAG: Nif11-like leader peptide family natural product precursor [Lachnospiraceae bacterium]|nr:Nif11-like leader peptide family natural product precursor [Lachnospiraceae bacterium]